MSNKPNAPQAMKIADYTGGMTDYVTGEADLTKYALAENQQILENRDLEIRPGSEINDLVNFGIPSAARLRTIVEINKEIYLHSGRSLYEPSGSGYIDIASESLFNASTSENDRATFATWADQTYCSNDTYSLINKVYKDELGNTVIRQAGLPDTRIYNAIIMANVFKDVLNAHTADGTQHPGAIPGDTVTAPDADGLDSLLTLVNDMQVAYTEHLVDAQSLTPAAHSGISSQDDTLDLTDEIQTIGQAVEFLLHIQDKLNSHDNDSSSHNATGAHQSALTASPNISNGSGVENYIYTFHYENTFRVGSNILVERGPVTFVEAKGLNAPAISLTNLPEIQNDSTTNYEVVTSKLVIGRSQSNGDQIFRLVELDNGINSYSDTTIDTDLVNNVGIYTEGGVRDDEELPKAKYLQIVNDVLVLGNVKEGAVVRENRVRFTKRFQPSSSPSDFFLDFESAVTGVGRLNTYPIIFEENRCYRLEGFFNALGQGGYRKREISNRHGAISHHSIINIQEGVLFASSDGFYYTDGFKVYKVSKDINETFAALKDKQNIEGVYDKERNLAIWSCKSPANPDYNDTLYVAHLNFRKSDGLPFTVWNGGQDDNQNFTATSLGYIDGTLLRGDLRGYLLKHLDEEGSDVVLDISKEPDALNTKAIRYQHISLSFDMGSSERRKWVPKINVNANNKSSLSLSIEQSRDNSGVFYEIKPILDSANPTWRDPIATWGGSDIRWNYTPTISAWRRFKSEYLRCQYFQLKLTNAFRTIDESSTTRMVTVDGTAKTAVLDNYPTEQWFDRLEEHFMSFEGDDYTAQFRILDVTDGTITLEDNENLLVDALSTEWKIQGYKKDEIFSLIDYVLHFSFMTTTQDQYRSLNG